MHSWEVGLMPRERDTLVVGRVIGDVLDPFIRSVPLRVIYNSREVANGCELKPSAVVNRPRVEVGGTDLRTFFYSSKLFSIDEITGFPVCSAVAFVIVECTIWCAQVKFQAVQAACKWQSQVVGFGHPSLSACILSRHCVLIGKSSCGKDRPGQAR